MCVAVWYVRFELHVSGTLQIEDLQLCFPEIGRILVEKRCRFKNCLHLSEPDCNVKGKFARYHMYC